MKAQHQKVRDISYEVLTSSTIISIFYLACQLKQKTDFL